MKGVAAEPAARVAGSAPYPWPFDGGPAGGRAAVLAIAAQAGVAGALGLGGAPTSLLRLARRARAAGVPVVAIRAGRRPGAGRPLVPGRGLVPERGTPSWHLLPAVEEEASVVVDAAGIDGFYGGDLDLELRARGTTHLVIAGLGTETFVHSTLRTANDAGYECLLVTDACAPADRALGEAAVAMVCMSGGIFGAVATAEAAAEWLETGRRE